MDNVMGFPLLTLIIFIPLLGAVIIMLFFDRNKTGAIKGFSTAVAVADFILSIPLWTHFDTAEADFQFVEKVSWIPTIGVSYFVAVDGISVLLVLLGERRDDVFGHRSHRLIPLLLVAEVQRLGDLGGGHAFNLACQVRVGRRRRPLHVRHAMAFEKLVL